MYTVRDFADKYKNKTLNIVIIIFALFIAANIYKSQIKAISLLRDKKEAEREKNELLFEINRLDKKLNLYKEFLGKKKVSSAINTISNIAKDTGVSIISLKPEREQVESFYIKYPFSLNVQAGSYHTMGKFISKLENNSDIYIVESLALKEEGKNDGASENGLGAKITLSTVVLQD